MFANQKEGEISNEVIESGWGWLWRKYTIYEGCFSHSWYPSKLQNIHAINFESFLIFTISTWLSLDKLFLGGFNLGWNVNDAMKEVHTISPKIYSSLVLFSNYNLLGLLRCKLFVEPFHLLCNKWNKCYRYRQDVFLLCMSVKVEVRDYKARIKSRGQKWWFAVVKIWGLVLCVSSPLCHDVIYS